MNLMVGNLYLSKAVEEEENSPCHPNQENNGLEESLVL
jgi:hypothetical protein